MSWHGPYRRGAAAVADAVARKQAEDRLAVVPHERTRAHRMGRCDCEAIRAGMPNRGAA